MICILPLDVNMKNRPYFLLSIFQFISNSLKLAHHPRTGPNSIHVFHTPICRVDVAVHTRFCHDPINWYRYRNRRSACNGNV